MFEFGKRFLGNSGRGNAFLISIVFLLVSCQSTPTVPQDVKGEQTLRMKQELQSILNQERNLWQRIDRRGTAQGEDSSLQSVADSYQGFVKKYPFSVEGWVLFGKYLRKTNQLEEAARCFVEANRLNPNLAVVKQQLGNYLVEKGQGEAALPYFLAAVKLEPDQALYHYQLGECLFQFRQELMHAGAYTRQQLDESMQEAFAKASQLEVRNSTFLTRYGESFFDVENPDWRNCLEVWQKLESQAPNDFYREAAQLYQARALGNLKRTAEAKKMLRGIQSPQLQKSRDLVLQEMGS